MFILKTCIFVTLLIAQVSYSRRFLIQGIDFKVHQFRRHHTVQFYGDERGKSDVIVRRGDHFDFTVKLNRNYRGVNIKLIFTFVTIRDKLTIKLPEDTQRYRWSMEQNIDDNIVNVIVYVPGNAPVGEWKMQVLVMNGRGAVVETLITPSRVIVLFNPWSSDDDVFFEEEDKLEEYIMNERGFTYTYDYTDWSPRPWIYGQFQPKVLDAVLFVLGKATLTSYDRGDIIKVSRELTFLLSDAGDRVPGVLRGKWQEPYDTFNGKPATKPWEWTGSPPILMKHYESRGEAVGYGQCWVFASVLTTVCRALGIAARPVTNMRSAHSKTRDLTIEVRLNRNGDIANEEPIWNFHVWTQLWFSRHNDLGQSLSGWQELDATPQERNEGRFQTGPASTFAILNSDLRTQYESAFLYEEVNADVVVFTHDDKIIDVDTAKVGYKVMTKAFGVDDHEDIVGMYKPEEGTEMERQSYRAAAKSLGITPPSLRPHIVARSGSFQVVIDIQTPHQLFLGSIVPAEIYFRNPSSRSTQLQISMKAKAMYYDGAVAEILKEVNYNMEIPGLNSKMLQLNLQPQEYIGRLHDENTICIDVFVTENSGEAAFQRKMFSLKTPQLNVYGPQVVNVNQLFTITVEIKNPFSQFLTDCMIAVEGIRISSILINLDNIAPGDIYRQNIQLQSSYALDETIVVEFYASNLIEMRSSLHVTVQGIQPFRFANYILREEERDETENINAEDLLDLIDPSKILDIKPDNFDCCEYEDI